MVDRSNPHETARSIVEDYGHRVVGTGHGGSASYLDIDMNDESGFTSSPRLTKGVMRDLLAEGIVIAGFGESDAAPMSADLRVWFDTIDLEHTDDGVELRLHNERY